MNYLPVKGPDLDSPLVTVVGIVLLSTIGLLFIFALLFSRAEKRERERAASIFFRMAAATGGVAVLALIVGGVAVGYSFLGFDRLSERNKAVQAQIERDYDLKLDRMEFHDLYYPQTEPQDDFKVYGSIQKNLPLAEGAYRSAKLSLVWSEGKFYLSESTNGEDFEPLKPKR